MILYIAEKASVGRALADVLPGERRREKNCIRCGSDVVAWASGHLLELCKPEDYDTRYKSWRLEDLPIIPETWRLREIDRTKKLLRSIRSLLKNASEVVHAGDADREGQLLIDEILEYCGWKGPTKRLRLNDVNPEAIRKALKNMKDNADYAGEYRAGQARSYADWLAGINLTRYCSVSVADAGYDGVFSVGRVQTPTLGLVVRRDREIENFVPKLFFVLSATLKLPTGARKVTGRWQPGEDAPGLDEEKRLADQAVCEALEQKLEGATGTITQADKKIRKEAPPLPYNLAKLQAEASKRYDITDTLKHLQKLYEQGYITYPRTDCRYIPEGHHAEAQAVLDSISSACPTVVGFQESLDVARRSGAWDDAKIAEHHAIIPTTKIPLEGALNEIERKVYELVCVRYAMQFMPECEIRETVIEFEAESETFRATGKEVLAPGWKKVEQGEEKADEAEAPEASLPSVIVGEDGQVTPSVEEKKTTPPKRFTYEGLLEAMNSIHRFVRDPEIRKQLRELDGIGTPATQENIIKLLFDRQFLEKKKKQIFSTTMGKALIDLLSESAAALVEPDLTALWEQKMSQIDQGELQLESFIQEVARMIGEIVQKPLAVPKVEGLKRRAQCLMEGCSEYLRQIKGKNGFFLACPVCKATFSQGSDGNPIPKKIPSGEVVEADCPLRCGRKARQFNGPYGLFWKCFCSPETTFKDVDGHPVVREDRPKAPCPVKGCKGKAEKLQGENGPFWKCSVCHNFFDDKDGKPVIRRKKGA